MVCVFARTTSEPLASLVKQIDEKIGENGKLKSFVVIMTKDGDKTAEVSAKSRVSGAGVKHVPLTMIGEKDGPPAFMRSPRMLSSWPDAGSALKVKVNHAYKGELTDKDVATILSGIPKVLAN